MKKAGTPYLAPLPSSLMVYMGVCTAMQQLPNKRLKQETRLGRCFHLELFIASSNLYRFFGWLNEMAFMTVDLQLVTITKRGDGTRKEYKRMHYAIPTVVVSECLGFSACRYNGDIIHNSFVSRLGEFARLVPVCPEVAIGLGVPRETVRLVKRGEERRLVQSSTNRDWTREMNLPPPLFLTEAERAAPPGYSLFSAVQFGYVLILAAASAERNESKKKLAASAKERTSGITNLIMCSSSLQHNGNLFQNHILPYWLLSINQKRTSK
ncbi:DUF523 domain-containing protein [Geobacillus thermoleovorans]|uniref:DUF523 domain-containing protein n=1 Tax=Geobacillus thermoleovorans TaxID=33941 RepID=UPI0009F2A63B